MKKRALMKILNTFAVSVYADQVITAHNEHKLLKIWKKNQDSGRFTLILGEGSNVLFLDNYKGTVVLNRIKGIFITESQIEWKLHVGAGEKWHELVMYTINKNIPGLENLVCIPGCVGSAIIHNIGAYGVELAHLCSYVDVLELNQGKKIRFDCQECCFQYRESIFKFHLYKYAIIFVGLTLQKKWKPVLNYLNMRCCNIYPITPRNIIKIIVLKRNEKLPSPVIYGNAGSFFKNPIVDAKIACLLLNDYPQMPYYRQLNGQIKLLAGWLIECCQLKGFALGEASVYYRHALVLINSRQKATGTEIAALALYIRNTVVNKFNVYLQPEVRLIGSTGEIDAEQYLAN